MSFELHTGDCIAVMRTLPANSVASIVTDPPYGLGFMDKAWDKGVPGVEFWDEMLRVAKPGAYLLAFGGTRTSHRMTCAIEDAGWEIRDTIMWLYGSGFPKSHNGPWGGTALKPAHEPIIMARKPLVGTVAANVLAYGTGGLNIDLCRVDTGEVNPSIARRQGAVNHLSDRPAAETEAEGKLKSRQSPEAYRAERSGEALGRWPANVIHDGSEEVLAGFPDAPGQQGRAKDDGEATGNAVYGAMRNVTAQPEPRAESDKSAARFFYCAKASRADRNDGCDRLAAKPLLWTSGDKSPGTFQSAATKRVATNNHPTVKPTDLMRYLCRLVTPAGGLVLDPFMGSGSTGRGALLEGFRFVGIEQDADYTAIAQHRIQAIALRKAA